MQSSTTIAGLLENLYGAAAHSAHWPQFLAAMTQATGATSGFVVALGEENAPALYNDYGFDSDFQHAYQSLFRSEDITLDRFLEAGKKPGGWVGVRQSLIPDLELEKSLFYNDFMQPRDIYHQAGLNLGRTGAYPHAGISLLRPKKQGEFSDDTVSLLKLLMPHFAQAFILHQRLVEAECERRLLRHASGPDNGVLLTVNGHGSVTYQTPEASSLLARMDGLLIRNGKLKAAVAKEDAVFQMLIQGAAKTGAGTLDSSYTATPGGALLVSRRPPRSALQVVVTPFHSETAFLGSSPSAVIFLKDPESTPQPRGVIMRQLYQLTPSEAKLADWLLKGLDVKETAERMRITENSARSLIKCIFRKTGVGSQSALMRLALSLPGVSPANGSNTNR